MTRFRNGTIILILPFAVGISLSCTERPAEPTREPEPELVAYLTYVVPDLTPAEWLDRADREAWDAYYDEAAESYSRALIGFEAARSDSGVFRAMLGLGVQLREMGRYDSSIVVLHDVLEHSATIVDSTDRMVTTVLQEIGTTSIRLSRYQDAVRQFRRIIERRLNENPIDSTEVGRAYHGLGWAFHELQDSELATSNFDTALTWYDSTRVGRFERSRTHNSLGATFAERFRHEDAINNFEISLKIRRAILRSDHAQTAIPLANLARQYGVIGQPTRGTETYKQAVAIFEKSLGRSHPQVAIAYGNLGNMYERSGELDKAGLYMQRALRIRQDVLPKDHKHLIYSYSELGHLAYRSGEYSEARRWIERAQFLLDSVHTSMWQMALGTEILRGNIAIRADSNAEAFRAYTKAHSIALLHQDSSDASLFVDMSLAQVVAEQGDSKAAQGILAETCPRILSQLGYSHWLVDKCNIIQAQIAGIAGNDSTAEAKYEYIVRSGENAATSAYGFEKVLILKEALSALAEYRGEVDALRLYERANQLAIDIRKGLTGDKSKLAIVVEASTTFSNTVRRAKSLYAATSDPDYHIRAFRAAEQGRAGVLLDAIAESQARRFSNIPDSLLALERDLRYVLSQSSTPGPDSTSASQNAQFFEANRNYSNLIREFESNYPEYYDLKYNTTIATIQDVQRSLLDNEALLEYSISDSIYVFGITSTESIFVTAAPIDSLDSNVERLLKGITEQRYGMFNMTAEKLYDLLIRRIEEFIEDKHLIVVPDGILNYVPFETLLPRHTPLDIELEYTILPFLIRDHPISYAYSATLFTKLRKLPPSNAEHDFIGMAPVFNDDIGTSTRSRNFIARNNRQVADQEQRVHLPGTLDEVIRIQKAFNRSYSLSSRLFGDKTRLLLNDSASEEAIKSTSIDNYRYVHFATHAFANDIDAEQSGLVLTTGIDSQEDGILSLAEVYNLKLNADIVVLSACETGLGKLESGEGMIGLTRGFLYAGSSNVVVSLWKADDTATRNLMVPFYQHLIRNDSPVIALQKAKVHAITRSRFHARPYFWAQFIMHGR